jgi:putative chitinase
MEHPVGMTLSQFTAAVGIPDERAFKWLPYVLETFNRYDISTPVRMSMWLAQCGHESNSFKDVVENLNYSDQALRRWWPKRFTNDVIAKEYARKPERIANRAYANRMGNGPEESGDGWRFRGRGLIQITGRACYQACANSIGVDCLNDPSLLANNRWAAISAGWFWETRHINALADAENVVAVTKNINGGSMGIEDRRNRYDRAIAVLSL